MGRFGGVRVGNSDLGDGWLKVGNGTGCKGAGAGEGRLVLLSGEEGVALGRRIVWGRRDVLGRGTGGGVPCAGGCRLLLFFGGGPGGLDFRGGAL